MSAAQRPAPDKVPGALGLGVIGTGMWGRAHAEVYARSPYSRLVAVCDLVEERARTVAERYGARSYTDLSAFLADPELEAVGIATPDVRHREPAVLAAEAGKHILLEKPLATNREDLDAIAEAVEKSGVRLMVDFHARFSPPIVAARDTIRRGDLGRPVSAYYRLNDVISVPLEMLGWAGESSILWFLGSHTVDTLRWLLGDEVSWVHSVSSTGVLRERGLDVPDIYQTLMQFRSGVIATIENNWIVPVTHPNVNDSELNLLGSAGMIKLDMSSSGVLERFLSDRYDQPDLFVKPEIHGVHSGFAYASIEDYVYRLATNQPFVAGLEDGLRVSRTVLAILESARKKETVPVEL